MKRLQVQTIHAAMNTMRGAVPPHDEATKLRLKSINDPLTFLFPSHSLLSILYVFIRPFPPNKRNSPRVRRPVKLFNHDNRDISISVDRSGRKWRRCWSWVRCHRPLRGAATPRPVPRGLLGGLVVRPSSWCLPLACWGSLTSPRGSISLQSSCSLACLGRSAASAATGSSGGGEGCCRFLCRFRNERSDAVADIVVLHAQCSGVAESEVDAVDVLGLGRAVDDIIEADVHQHLLQPLLRRFGDWSAFLAGLTADLVWPSPVDDPGRRSTVEDARGALEVHVHVLLGVGVLGDALIDVELGLVDGINLVHEAVDPAALGLDDIRVATLVDLPPVIPKPGSADVLAVGASPLHLLEVKVAAIGKVEDGRTGIGPLLADCVGRHDED